MMMKTIFLLGMLLFSCIELAAQPTKEITRKSDTEIETYFVLSGKQKIKHGPYSRTDLSGKPIEEGFYKMGKRDSTWKEYGWGWLLWSGPYVNDQKHGVWKRHSNDKVISSVVYVNGKKNPEITYYNYDSQQPEQTYNPQTKKMTWLDAAGQVVKVKSFSAHSDPAHAVVYENDKPVQVYDSLTTRVVWFDTLALTRQANEMKILVGTDSVTVVVDYPPIQPGGLYKLQLFLMRNIRYPQEAKEKGIMGTVYIAYDIGTDGVAHNFRIVKRAHPLLDKEALRVVQSYGQSLAWVPASYQGRPVETTLVLPVKFSLQ